MAAIWARMRPMPCNWVPYLANTHATSHHAPTCTCCRLHTIQASKAWIALAIKHLWGACMVNAILRQLQLRTGPSCSN